MFVTHDHHISTRLLHSSNVQYTYSDSLAGTISAAWPTARDGCSMPVVRELLQEGLAEGSLPAGTADEGVRILGRDEITMV